ncbi:hypothetical protein EJ07DRAFT_156623 [Lizonia empirigonia]|nr:hypothetical protein EJ07DRAFT_156623 [Lizonia empirigonia]
MAPPTTPQATPPSGKFSYPARQDAATLPPQHNQDNPPMAPNDSRLFLPRLPSAILASRSATNLHSQFNFELQRSSNTENDSFYHHHNRAGTSHTLASRSVPDFNLTALPPPPLPPLPVQTQGQGQGLSPINIQTSSPKKLIKSPPRSPTKSTKSSRWRHVGRKIKRVFTFGRQRKKTLEIGSPYGFRHVETHGTEPLRTAAPVGDAATAGRVEGGLEVRGEPSGQAAAGRLGRLGRLDVEGTAVEDDGASEWEDYVGDTTIFFQQQGTLGRRA